MSGIRRYTVLLPILLGIGIIWLSQHYFSLVLSFSNTTTTVVTQLFGVLFTVALLLERSLEVFINVWREPDASQLELKAQDAQVALVRASALDQTIPANQTQVTQAVSVQTIAAANLQTYRSGTQKIALWCAFVAGLTVSAVGLRTLETFLGADSRTLLLSPGHEVQQLAFHFVDIWLTGGLLAGGSEGIHKLTQAYSDFMDATSKRAKSAT